MNAHLRDDEDTANTPMSGVKRECAQRPRNHTRTCNKLRTVNWFTGEVR